MDWSKAAKPITEALAPAPLGGLQTCKKLKATARVTVRDATGNATVKTYKLTIRR